MIREEQSSDGILRGAVVCGNKNCGKTLYTYIGEENEPGPFRSVYLLTRIETRFLFIGESGYPLSAPLWFQGMEDIVDLMMQLDGRAVGYRWAETKALMEDFCSDRCASQSLKDNLQWGLCLHRQGNSEMLRFVAQEAERFKTQTLRIPIPGT